MYKNTLLIPIACLISQFLNCSRLLIFIMIVLPSFLYAKLTIVFDIDETLCFRTENSKFDIIAFQARYPHIKIIQNLSFFPDQQYFLIPHFDLLIRYLLEKDFEIHFFSAACERRNKELVERILVMSLGLDRYEQEVKAGQFRIFSNYHMVPRFANINTAIPCEDDELCWAVQYRGKSEEHPPDLAALDMQRATKKLRDLLPEKHIDDVILVDDRLENATSHYFEYKPIMTTVPAEPQRYKTIIVHDKTELPLLTAGSCPGLIDLLDVGAYNSRAYLVLNSSFYYCGVIMHCLNLMKIKVDSLRQALSVALNIDEADHGFTNLLTPEDCNLNSNLPFYLELGRGKFKTYLPGIEFGSLKPHE